MKKLSLLTSIVLAIFTSCGRKVHSQKATESHTSNKDSIFMESARNDSLNRAAKKRDATKKWELRNEHLSPEQKTLDSIKAVKTKNKDFF
jgi:hypothetical protein